MKRILILIVGILCNSSVRAAETSCGVADAENIVNQRAVGPVSGELTRIKLDSEYLLFVIDSSGSMFNYAWQEMQAVVADILQRYPKLKGIQVANHGGAYLFPSHGKRWLSDSREQRDALLEALETWHSPNGKSIFYGLRSATNDLYESGKKISIVLLGDEDTNTSLDKTAAILDQIPALRISPNPNLSIHAIGFPVQFCRPENMQETGIRFAAAMREVTRRNNGSFIGLSSYQSHPDSHIKADTLLMPRTEKHTLILLDVSASMGGDTMKFMQAKKIAPEVLLNTNKWYLPGGAMLSPATINSASSLTDPAGSAKWQHSVNLLNQTANRLPEEGLFQIYTFDDAFRSLWPGTEGRWLSVGSRAWLPRIADWSSGVSPSGRRDFEQVFASVKDFSPFPDQIVLITDGLPTYVAAQVASDNFLPDLERVTSFRKQASDIPAGVRVNVLLVSEHGSPLAASEFWKLAIFTQGTFQTVAN